MRTGIFLRLTVATTSTHCMGSTWMGIFMSYIGLFSYYQFENWAYQPSYVSSNTPWFFNGVRVQIFPTEHLKIEPWFTNGWQSYGRFNGRPGFGLQLLWRPNGWLSVLGNQYSLGHEAPT